MIVQYGYNNLVDNFMEYSVRISLVLDIQCMKVVEYCRVGRLVG